MYILRTSYVLDVWKLLYHIAHQLGMTVYLCSKVLFVPFIITFCA